MNEKQENALIAGGMILACAVGWFVFFGNTKGSCELTGAAVPLIAKSLDRGESPAVLVGTAVGGVVISEHCEEALSTLSTKPNQPVNLKIDNGRATQSTQLSGSQFRLSQPTTGPANTSHVEIACYLYSSPSLEDLCLKGIITPP